MSSPQPSPPAAAASSVAGKKRKPQHFHAGPNPVIDEESKEDEQQSADHVSPIARLYRHALESVFSFLLLPDLSRCLAVRRTLAAAVRSMKSIDARVEQPELLPSVLCASSLAHHVSSVLWKADGSSVDHDCRDLRLMSLCLPNLTALSCQVGLPQPTPLLFSAKLTDVNIGFTCDEAAVPSINAAILTISRLPLLTKLSLNLPRFYPMISFAALQSSSLVELNLRLADGSDSPPLTRQQLDQLRALVKLRMLDVDNLAPQNLKYLIRAPHQLQWQQIACVRTVDESMSTALSTLPTLTALQAHGCRSVGFLSSLVGLRTLDLFLSSPHAVSPDVLVTALSHCSRLEGLNLLGGAVTSAHLSTLLPRLPLLRTLALTCCSELQSLAFFSECASLHRTLTSFSLEACDHPNFLVTEMRQLYALSALTALRISSSLAEPLDALSQSLHTPPSLLMPSLTDFDYEPPFIELEDPEQFD